MTLTLLENVQAKASPQLLRSDPFQPSLVSGLGLTLVISVLPIPDGHVARWTLCLAVLMVFLVVSPHDLQVADGQVTNVALAQVIQSFMVIPFTFKLTTKLAHATIVVVLFGVIFTQQRLFFFDLFLDWFACLFLFFSVCLFVCLFLYS